MGAVVAWGLAMPVEDRDSFLAQRYFTGSMQLRVLSGERPQTWQAAYEVRDDNFHQVVDALRDVRAANREGDAERLDEIVAMELGSSSEQEAEEEAEEEMPIEGHRCALCGLTWPSVTLMLPTGRWATLAIEERLVCDDCFEALQ